MKAKDEHGAEGPWGVHQINVPRPRQFIFIQFLERILERFPLLQQILNTLLNL